MQTGRQTDRQTDTHTHTHTHARARADTTPKTSEKDYGCTEMPHRSQTVEIKNNNNDNQTCCLESDLAILS